MEQHMKEQINEIVSDESKSVEERIDMMFSLRDSLSCDDESQGLKLDVQFFTSLIEMVIGENGPHVYDRELLQLYVLLAETYVGLHDYRELGDVARGVLDVIRYDVTGWEAMEDTLPRIIDAVGESVYNHALYELLLYYLRAAYQAGKLDSSFAGRARKMLKLKVLLDDSDWLDRLLDKELQKAIAGLFSSEELLNIILRPQIGHLRKDPVEYTWEWEDIYYDVESKLEERFASAPRFMGFCFTYWNAKRELLEEEYGIKWHSPSQMNPGVMFD